MADIIVSSDRRHQVKAKYRQVNLRSLGVLWADDYKRTRRPWWNNRWQAMYSRVRNG